ncbi:MAG: TRAP transporter fused permease subunit [Pirellulales bacterium]|nr:TRAP transporter fused permease subunit [Pirellulales bacterium]
MKQATIGLLSVVLCAFTLVEVNYAYLQPQSALAIFIGIGLCLCFITQPVSKALAERPAFKTPLMMLDSILAVLSLCCCAYLVTQLEPSLKAMWLGGRNLGDRAGIETMPTIDFVVGVVGIVLVLEATRRTIGWIVPLLATLFLVQSYYCHLSETYRWVQLPAWLFPHNGQSIAELVETTFLQSTGVFGAAADVMFKFVFLFAVFGCFLEMTGATDFIIRFAERIFGRSPGGPAKVAVLGSGLLGSLSGSAVANAMTTGTFTIPMMRSSGFGSHIAGGITAAAASGGALVPPIMGAGAYMMMQFCQRTNPETNDSVPVQFAEIAIAAIIPAVLYYLSILLFVHFYSRRVGSDGKHSDGGEAAKVQVPLFEGVVFASALGALIAMLAIGSSPNLAVTGALAVILVLAALRPKLPLSGSARGLALAVFAAFFALYVVIAIFVHQVDFTANSINSNIQAAMKAAILGMLALIAFGLIHSQWRASILGALSKAARQGVPLVAASACVGIIIGVLGQTGITNDFADAVGEVVQDSKILALIGIMFLSLILGMGVPSVVCYLLLATLMGPVLTELGTDPLAAHMFIFYFGLMSMVTPPVALAAYASASIANAKIMPTAFAAFRFALVGFTLPYMFVYRPELLLLDTPDFPLTWNGAVWSISIALAGVFSLAVGLAGFLRGPLLLPVRIGMFFVAAMLLSPDIVLGEHDLGLSTNITAMSVLVALCIVNWVRTGRDRAT